MKTFYICDDCGNELTLSEFNQQSNILCKECGGRIEETSKKPIKYSEMDISNSKSIEKKSESKSLLVSCESCSHQYSKRANKCPKCGSKLLIVCQVCHKKIPNDSSTCSECGDPEPFQEQQGKRLPKSPPPINTSEVGTKSNKNQSDQEWVAANSHTMFSNMFSFQGRIRRMEYGISFIIYVIIASLVNALIETEEFAIVGLAYIPMQWFLWAQGAKRCHDRGNNGWYQIIPFYVLYMIFGDGETGLNQYGSNPKGKI